MLQDGKNTVHFAVENKVSPILLEDIIRMGGDPNRLDKVSRTIGFSSNVANERFSNYIGRRFPIVYGSLH